MYIIRTPACSVTVYNSKYFPGAVYNIYLNYLSLITLLSLVINYINYCV